MRSWPEFHRPQAFEQPDRVALHAQRRAPVHARLELQDQYHVQPLQAVLRVAEADGPDQVVGAAPQVRVDPLGWQRPRRGEVEALHPLLAALEQFGVEPANQVLRDSRVRKHGLVGLVAANRLCMRTAIVLAAFSYAAAHGPAERSPPGRKQEY